MKNSHKGHNFNGIIGYNEGYDIELEAVCEKNG